tara:strand:- start:303 stop:2285 length:1983 start_codon:yes stop_codon:yes gene_type:complete
MGNTATSGNSLKVDENDNKTMNLEMVKELDKIASDYIHTLSLDDLKNLAEGNTQYCKELIIVSSKLLNEKYNNIQIKGIFDTKYDETTQRVEKDGDDKYFYSYKKENIEFDKEERKKLCTKIGKYYVRVAHIFAAIVKALHPMYKSSTGELESYITRRNRKDTSTDLYYKGICEKRMKDLYTPIDGIEDSLSEISSNDGKVKIKKENICSKENSFNIYGKSELSKLKYLYESDKDFKESAIDKLDEIHNKSLSLDYNKSTSSKAIESFLSSSKNKYNSIGGDGELKFNFSGMNTDKEVHPKDTLCKKLANVQDDSVQIKQDNKFYLDYKEHIQVMLEHMKKHKKSLIEILNTELFEKKDDVFLVKSGLTIKKLNALTEYVRKVIVNMYLTCEEDYLIGLKLLERIIEFTKLSEYEDKKKYTQELAETGKIGSNNISSLLSTSNESSLQSKENSQLNYNIDDNESNRITLSSDNSNLVSLNSSEPNIISEHEDGPSIKSDPEDHEDGLSLSSNTSMVQTSLSNEKREYQKVKTNHSLFNFVEFLPRGFYFIITSDNSSKDIVNKIIEEKINIARRSGSEYENLSRALANILKENNISSTFSSQLSDIKSRLDFISDATQDNNENAKNEKRDEIYKIVCNNILIPELSRMKNTLQKNKAVIN